MLRLLLNLIVTLTASFIALSITAHTVGITQPPNPALAGFGEGCEEKPPPCWYGIVPGVTRLTEAISALELYGYSNPLQFDQTTYNYAPPPGTNLDSISLITTQGSVILAISLKPRQDIYLGDLLDANADLMLGFASPPKSIIFSPDAGVGVVVSYGAKRLPSLSLHTQNIYSIALYPIDEFSSEFGWHGFVFMWRYCQLEGTYPLCRELSAQ